MGMADWLNVKFAICSLPLKKVIRSIAQHNMDHQKNT